MTRAELVEQSNQAAESWDPRDGAAAVPPALEALRLAVLALVVADDDVTELEQPVWARVELFGHTVVYGEVIEHERYGRHWLEVVTPALWEDDDHRDGDPDIAQRRKLYHPNAVYAFEEMTEADVRSAWRSRTGLAYSRRSEESDDV